MVVGLEVRRHARRGRGLYTAQDVAAGETVLVEKPLLLYVAQEMTSLACAHCLRLIQSPGREVCQACSQAHFCSAACYAAAIAAPEEHGQQVCSVYAATAAALSGEEANQARFLAHALALQQVAGQQGDARFAQLLQLQGEGDRANDIEAVSKIATVIASGFSHANSGSTASSSQPTMSDLARLLRIEQLNSYGILAPNRDGGERVVRGSAVYARASLINHECIPNVARFDAFDSADGQGSTNTSMTFRALHALPRGTEVVQSYCPLHWSYAERQAQCHNVFGFHCGCPRCQTESAWSDDDEDSDGEDSTMGGISGDTGPGQTAAGAPHGTAGTSSMGPEGVHLGEHAAAGKACCGAMEVDAAATSSSQMWPDLQDGLPYIDIPEEPPLEEAYLQLFLLKYMCPVADCLGTLAPLQPGSSLFECNVCGGQRSEQQFMEELDASGGGD